MQISKLFFVFLISFIQHPSLYAQWPKTKVGGKQDSSKITYPVRFGLNGNDTIIESLILLPDGEQEIKSLTCNLSMESMHENWKQYVVHPDDDYVYSELRITNGILGMVKAFAHTEQRTIYYYENEFVLKLDTVPFIVINNIGDRKIDTTNHGWLRYTGIKKNNIPIFERMQYTKKFEWTVTNETVGEIEKRFFGNVNRLIHKDQKLNKYYCMFKILQHYRLDFFDADYYPAFRSPDNDDLAKRVYLSIENDSLREALFNAMGHQAKDILSIAELRFLYNESKKIKVPSYFSLREGQNKYEFAIHSYSKSSRLNDKNERDKKPEDNDLYYGDEFAYIIKGTITKKGIMNETEKIPRRHDPENRIE